VRRDRNKTQDKSTQQLADSHRSKSLNETDAAAVLKGSGCSHFFTFFLP
jgi:hypothetical protein